MSKTKAIENLKSSQRKGTLTSRKNNNKCMFYFLTKTMEPMAMEWNIYCADKRVK